MSYIFMYYSPKPYKGYVSVPISPIRKTEVESCPISELAVALTVGSGAVSLQVAKSVQSTF